MNSNKKISRVEALKKIGKYGALTSIMTYTILEPLKAQCVSPCNGGSDGSDDRPGSIWKD